ncbi:MAG: iron ABC transporter permease [Pseudohongiellaceae bacterium]
MNTRTNLILFFLLLIASLGSVVFSLAVGSIDINFARNVLEIFRPSGSLESQILHELRLPRALAAYITGGLLALSGVIMQVLLRNPLADPYILGISGGAAVAALSSIIIGVSAVWVPQAAFVGAMFSIALVFGIANTGGQRTVTRLLLTGVVISAGWGAVINILLTTSSSNNVQSMLFWLMGDLSQSRFALWQAVILFLGLATGIASARSLNVLARGEQTAITLGVNAGKLRLLLYFTASLLTACAVTIAGTVGFVGLITPHLLRMTGASDHRLLVPFSVMLGGSFLVVADTLARTMAAPQQLPVGVITALIGVPLFILILRNASGLKK